MRRQTPLGWLRHDATNRGITAWLLSAVFFAFYVGLYFSYVDSLKSFAKAPLSELPGNWTLIGCLYGLALLGTSIALVLRARREPGYPLVTRAILAFLGVTATAALFYLTLHGMDDFIKWSVKQLRGPVASLAIALGYFEDTKEGVKAARKIVSQWTVYGLIYSLAIVGGGLYMIWKYRHNRYQIVRTCCVMLVQVTLGFSIPIWLKFMDQPDYYFSYLWPLKIDVLYPDTMSWHASKSILFVLYSIVGAMILVPLLAAFFGKRWYCSWVCGCGGLANTFGEPWRHLSTKGSTSWRIERITIHTVLVAAFLTTGLVIAAALLKDRAPGLEAWGAWVRGWYGVLVVAILSGVVGVGIYPIGGTRVWCRYACPMAALLGLTQKFGRFRIRVKQDMCISCGMCSKYCEMGIDVRSYAQANQSFTRASCVGCGLCSEVCPRGVLRLENIVKKDPQELLQITDLDEHWKGSQVAVGARN